MKHFQRKCITGIQLIVLPDRVISWIILFLEIKFFKMRLEWNWRQKRKETLFLKNLDTQLKSTNYLSLTSKFNCPYSGWVDELGEGDGRGYNVCVPLGYRSSEADLQVVFEQLLLPILFQFKPQFLAISAGFDAYEKDPIGVLGVTNRGFSNIGSYIHQIVSDLDIPFANFLEGGYNIQMLPNLVSSYINPLIHPENDYDQTIQSLKPNTQTLDTVNQAKNLLKDYWEL